MPLVAITLSRLKRACILVSLTVKYYARLLQDWCQNLADYWQTLIKSRFCSYVPDLNDPAKQIIRSIGSI
jgi:hypothetical protein